MVEFAIILPILVLLVFGITELGRALYQWNTLTKAVAVGARYMARSNSGVLDEDCDRGGNWDTHRDNAREFIVYGKTDPSGSDEPLLYKLDTVPLYDGTSAPGVDEYIWITHRTGGASGSPYEDVCVIEVEAVVPFDWIIGPLIPFDFVDSITLTARTEERYIGE